MTLKDFEEVDLSNPEEVDVQITEREGRIDSLHGEIDRLHQALASFTE